MSISKNAEYNYGQALRLMRDNYRVARKSWPENCCCVFRKGYPDGIPCNEETANAWNIPTGTLIRINPYLQKKLEDGTYSMWQPTIEDLLADDWIIRD